MGYLSKKIGTFFVYLLSLRIVCFLLISKINYNIYFFFSDCVVFVIKYAEYFIHGKIDHIPNLLNIAKCQNQIAVYLYVCGHTKNLDGYESFSEKKSRLKKKDVIGRYDFCNWTIFFFYKVVIVWFVFLLLSKRIMLTFMKLYLDYMYIFAEFKIEFRSITNVTDSVTMCLFYICFVSNVCINVFFFIIFFLIMYVCQIC